ncbi:SoxR reducing system RseC family protein [Porticoccaceae bacterium LTM1]|nr:SoxR reducing system RseC family protein [Porticoccaceae bacterium LTM1]
MIRESATVTSVESDCLWVEVIQKSTCGSCAVRQGCGQHLVAKLTGRVQQIRVLPGNTSLERISVGDQVVIEIQESVVVKGATLVYLLPLVALISASGFSYLQQWPDSITALFALTGFILGALVVRWHSRKYSNDNSVNPVLAGCENKPLNFVK